MFRIIGSTIFRTNVAVRAEKRFDKINYSRRNNMTQYLSPSIWRYSSSDASTNTQNEITKRHRYNRYTSSNSFFTFRRVVILGICSLPFLGLAAYAFYDKKKWEKIRSKQPKKPYESGYWHWLPLNAMSRLAGRLAEYEVPLSLRSRLYGAFARNYGCRMDEAEHEDFEHYTTFAAFFNRPLKKYLRPISNSALVSPADGIVLNVARVVDNKIEQIKGFDYRIEDFLGPIELQSKSSFRELYAVAIYLAPGNYHGFHSPAQWTTEIRRHYPGLLLSVRPSVLKLVPQLFCRNERVVINGRWKHGFFSMTAVAATNVGDIVIHTDPYLKSNSKYRRTLGEWALREKLNAGDPVGEFRFGSSIVLIFEAPTTIRFAIAEGDTIKYGQSLVVSGV